MPYGLYLSAEGATAQQKRLEVIANNLANVNTPGFKPGYATFQARFAEAIEQGLLPEETESLENIGGGIEFLDVKTNFQQGPVKQTSKPTDITIDGEGFFQVRKEGQTLLTRAGNFLLSATGELKTQQGYSVLATSGEPVVISTDQGPWHVTPDGAIQQAGSSLPLAIVHPVDITTIQPLGENLFTQGTGTEPIPVVDRTVRSGFLEMSGVNPTNTMMELIETSRAIEANMKLIQNQDNMTGSLISRVLQS